MQRTRDAACGCSFVSGREPLILRVRWLLGVRWRDWDRHPVSSLISKSEVRRKRAAKRFQYRQPSDIDAELDPGLLWQHHQNIDAFFRQPLRHRNPLATHIGNPLFRVVFPIRYASEPADAADGSLISHLQAAPAGRR